MTFIKLKCQVQHYAWGEKSGDGKLPYIAELLGEEPGALPWAELWMGAHPKASAMLVNEGIGLDKAIDMQPMRMLGNHAKLSFLLKVLCCSRPLSIQSHPDKTTAERLHIQYPDEFPDDNHKPEVLWALSPFRVLAGFRPLDEAIADLEGKISLAHWANLLRETGDYSLLCRNVFEGDIPCLEGSELNPSNDRDLLFMELSRAYPGDEGAFFAYLLNYIRLKPGEAVFVPANTPHAYIEGRGIECMACSDNVIRAGLTPKSKRKDLLMETLDFSASAPERMMAVNASANEFCLDASPDFKLTIVRGQQLYDFMEKSPAITCVLSGNITLSSRNEHINAKKGDVFFKTADAESARLEGCSDEALVAIAEE